MRRDVLRLAHIPNPKQHQEMVMALCQVQILCHPYQRYTPTPVILRIPRLDSLTFPTGLLRLDRNVLVTIGIPTATLPPPILLLMKRKMAWEPVGWSLPWRSCVA